MIGVVLVFIPYYFCAGNWVPYLPLWLKDQGLRADEIAVILGLPALLRVVSAPLFSYVGDIYGKRRVIRIMASLGGLAAALLLMNDRYWPILALASITFISWQSMNVQLDSIAIEQVRKKAVPGYGVIRACGSSAFISATLAGSAIMTSVGTDGILIAFVTSAALLVLATSQVSAKAGMAAPTEAAMPVTIWRQPRLISVLVAAALVHAAHAGFASFGALHMRQIGFSNMSLGIIIAMATAAEITMFFFGHLIMGWLRPIQWIAVGAAIATLRWVATAFVVTPLPLMALQLTHAFTFSCTYMGMIGYLVETVDQRQIARAQGMYIAMLGIFNSLVTLAVGSAFESMGSLAFIVSAVPTTLSLLIIGLRLRSLDPKFR